MWVNIIIIIIIIIIIPTGKRLLPNSYPLKKKKKWEGGHLFPYPEQYLIVIL